MAKLTKKMALSILKEKPEMLYSAMPAEFADVFPVITVNAGPIHGTIDHHSKMLGMQSISTTCKVNHLCKGKIYGAALKLFGPAADHMTAKEIRQAAKKYIKENPLSQELSICLFCFSDSQQDAFDMSAPLIINHNILNGGIINRDWLPVINALYFRFESFGDFASVNAVINAFNLAKYNKNVNFTAWTKNPYFFKKAIEQGHKKPKNFKLVLSSQYINRPAKIPECYADIVDAVFTVYTKEYADLHNITINCGARACLACLRCYTGYKKGDIKVINELLK